MIALQLTRSPMERMINAFVDNFAERAQWLRTLDEIQALSATLDAPEHLYGYRP